MPKGLKRNLSAKAFACFLSNKDIIPPTTSTDEHDMTVALAWGGQYIMIIRDLNMVIVTTASDYDNGSKARSKVPMVIEEIVPIFK